MENNALQQRADDKKDRDIIKQLRRDLEEAKRRAADAVSESNTVRRERDTLRVEKNDQLMHFIRDIEELKTKLREQEAEAERCQFKYQAHTESNQKMALKLEKKSAEVYHA